MIEFVKSPNLPFKSVKTVVAGKMPDEVKRSLKDSKIKVFEIKTDNMLQNAVSSHADLQCIHLGGNKIMLNNTQEELKDSLLKLGFDVSSFEIKNGKYPYDCAVNAAVFGKNVICKFDILENTLKDYLAQNGYKIINVNQGYSKCSVCIVDDNSVITEDETINNACINNGIDVLLIRKGFVKLDGFDYGFIGGASFKINENTLCFIGKIENHPDFNKIKKFLSDKNIEYKSLSETVLTDIGSVLPITE